MDSSVSPKDEIWFLHVCHHISIGLYRRERDPVATAGLDAMEKRKKKLLMPRDHSLDNVRAKEKDTS